MLQSKIGSMSSRGFRRILIGGAMLVVVCACTASNDHSSNYVVNNAVPEILQTWLPYGLEMRAGDTVSANIARLKLGGWAVSEFTSDATHDLIGKKYPREYIIDVPPKMMNEPESGLDFSTTAMVLHWQDWNSLFWQTFFRSKQEFDSACDGHFFRVIAPTADRVYDVVIIRRSNPEGSLFPGRLSGTAASEMWADINPKHSDDFPRMSVFGPVRFVEPVAAKQFDMGKYSISQVYARRYYATGSFFGAEYGRRRARDTYILVLLSKKEFVVVQTLIFNDTTSETIIADMGRILGRRFKEPA